MLAGEPVAAAEALERASALLVGSPLITQELALTYEAAGMGERAAPLWSQIGQSALSFTQVGERYRAAGRLEEALVWYRRAAALDPALADPWYYSGLVAAARKEWTEAQRSFDAALERPAFVTVGVSDLLTQKALAFYREDPGQASRSLALYQQARERADFRSNLLEATAVYEVGQILDARGDNPTEAAASYQAALAIRPGHQWARMRLGRLLFTRLNDFEGAEVQLRWAIEQIRENADHKWAYRWLGDLYREQGRPTEALAAYREAARLDPSDAAVQKALDELEPSAK